MIQRAARFARRLLRRTTPEDSFLSFHYQRHTQRRLEHLASLGLEMAGSTVLEVGAGIGDHTSFFLDRDCRVTSTEARTDNLDVLRKRYPSVDVAALDLDAPGHALADRQFDIVYCYGVLYHLKHPAEAIAFLARHCRKVMLVETCVSFGDENAINPCAEPANDPSQSVSGVGCRPTRPWVRSELHRHFPFVYMPLTQPSHAEFPIDWTVPSTAAPLARAIFIASRDRLANILLVEQMPMRQTR